MHQVRVSSDRFVVSATARRPGDGTRYPTADLRDAARIPPNQAALSVRRIPPEFSARRVWHEPGLREDARNAHSGAGDSCRGNPQKNNMAYLRPSLRCWDERFTEASSRDGSSNGHRILPIRRICLRIDAEHGKNTPPPRTHVGSLWKQKGAELRGTLRGTEIDLLLRNQLHSWDRLSYPAPFQVRGMLRECGKSLTIAG